MQINIVKINETIYNRDIFYDGIRKILSGEDENTNEGSLFYNMMIDYMMEGDMPYGTMKARDGDPYEWTYARIEREYS